MAADWLNAASTFPQWPLEEYSQHGWTWFCVVESPQCRQDKQLTKASLVASSDQNPPLLGSGLLGTDRGIQGLLPVIQGQDVQSHLSGLGLSSPDRIMSVGSWNVIPELVDIGLELGLVLLELICLSRCKNGQGQES